EYFAPTCKFRLIAEASWSTTVEFICSAITLLAHSCAHTYVTFAPGPAIRSFTPQAKPGAVRLHDRKCSITVTFANSSATRSRCGNTDILSWRSQWKISIGNSISSPRGTNNNVPDEARALCNAANLAEPSVASVDMKYFRKRSACSTMARSSG